MRHAIPEAVKRLALLPGPFATVHLDTTRTTEHGSDEITLRWQEQRAALRAAGADDATLGALDGVVGTHTAVGGPRGQVVVASGDTVHFDRALPAPPPRSWSTWSALPHLVPYLASRAPAIGHVLVVADHAGADIAAVEAQRSADAAPPDRTTSVGERRTHPLHETGRNTWNERHFQNRVQNAWADNARDVADEVAKAVAQIGAELVVLAGDPRARSLLRAEFKNVLGPGVTVLDVDTGGRAAGSSPEALDGAVSDAVLRYSWRLRREVLEHLQRNVGRGEFAVTGPDAVLTALRRAQVDTVVLSDDPSSTLSAWIGPSPLEVATSEQELRDMGVSDPTRERFDAALLRAAAGSDAHLVITPNAHDYVDGGIAALLRYDDAATPGR